MSKKPYQEIEQISPQNREIIQHKTAYSLPDDPSAREMRPDRIRRHFWEALAGSKVSLICEIDRVAKETNAAFDALWLLLCGTVEIDGKTVGIADLINTGLKEGYIAAICT